MSVFCPTCGTENEGAPGGQVTCRACTASFEVPHEAGAQRPQAPGALPSFAGRPVRPLAAPQRRAAAPSSRDDEPAGPPAAPAPLDVKPPPHGWGDGPTPRAAPLAAQPGAFAPAPTPSGTTNGLAIASLVCGLLCCIPFASLSAIITGVLALNQLSARGNVQKGRELALAGITLGILSCFLTLSVPLFRAISR